MIEEIERRFGRIQSPIDRRDWELEDFIPPKFTLVIPNEKAWEFPADPLDQENTPHCVGFDMAHFGICLPTFTPYTKEDAHDFYYMCKEIDGDPTGEDGTTMRSAAKVLQDVGAIDNYAFAREIDSIKTWVLTKGPIMMGTIWTENMMSPNDEGILDVGGYVIGGHAWLLTEWNVKEGYITLQNSWGKDWGILGKAYISIEDFKFLFSYGGEALAAVELENYRSEKKGWFIKLLNKLFGSIKDWLGC